MRESAADTLAARVSASLRRVAPDSTAPDALAMRARMRFTFSVTSFAALALCSAKVRTSCATTANPRPALPARAASIAALSANRLVCVAISEMTPTKSSITAVASRNAVISTRDSSTDSRAPSNVSIATCT